MLGCRTKVVLDNGFCYEINKGYRANVKANQVGFFSGVSGRHYIYYALKAQLPLRLLCYDLSPLSAGVTGDLYTPQMALFIMLYGNIITSKSSLSNKVIYFYCNICVVTHFCLYMGYILI